MKKELKDSSNFNKWFNDQFEKHRLEDPVEHGYGNWLKSDDDIVFTPQNINKDSMAREMDKRKRKFNHLLLIQASVAHSVVHQQEVRPLWNIIVIFHQDRSLVVAEVWVILI